MPLSLTSSTTCSVDASAAARVRIDERAAFGHRIHGIEDQVRQRIADVALDAHDPGQIARQVGLHLDHDAALLRHVAPARTRQIDHLADQQIELHGCEVRLLIALPIELTHAGHGLADIVDRALDDAQVFTRRAR